MYDRVDEVRNLNRIEGFDPRQYMRNLTGSDGTVKQYLDVVYRKLWLRLKNPEGKIVKKLVKLTEQTAIVEARICLNKTDPEDSYIASAFAQKFVSQDEQFGAKFLELAETAAVGRALADAGYGLQFADLEGEQDPNVLDAPLGQNRGEGSNYISDMPGSMTGEVNGSQGQQAVPNQNPVMAEELYQMNEVFPFDISDIVFLLNLKIRRKNQTSWDCDCPFCGKEGKLNINLEKNVFRCNKCGEGGGQIQLYSKVYGLDRAAACEQIKN